MSALKIRFHLVFTIMLFAGFLIQQSATAQQPYFESYSYKVDKAYIASYWTVTKKIPTGPARWKGQEWAVFSGVIIGGAMIYAFDDEIRKMIQKYPSKTKDNLSTYMFEPWGSGVYPALLLGGFYIYGVAADNNRARQVGLGGVQVLIMTTLSTQIIKHLTHRHRPDQDDPPNPRLWEGPFTGWENFIPIRSYIFGVCVGISYFINLQG